MKTKGMAKIPFTSAVSSIMYAKICSRSDFAHSVGVVSRFMSNLRKKYWEAVTWLLRYLKVLPKLHYVSEEDMLFWKDFFMQI